MHACILLSLNTHTTADLVAVHVPVAAILRDEPLLRHGHGLPAHVALPADRNRLHLRVCMRVCMYVCMYTHVAVSVPHTYTTPSDLTYVWVRVCAYIHTYIHTYTHTGKHTREIWCCNACVCLKTCSPSWQTSMCNYTYTYA